MFGRSMFMDFDEDPFFATDSNCSLNEESDADLSTKTDDDDDESEADDSPTPTPRDQTRRMMSMQAMLHDPFPSMLSLGDGRMQRRGDNQQNQMMSFNDFFNPCGIFESTRQMMNQMQNSLSMHQDTQSSSSFSQSSFMFYSNVDGGPPKVYQASSSTHKRPGGIRETQRFIRDSESGHERMAIGHHIYDRGHVMKRSRNTRTGDREEHQDLINLDEADLPSFNHEWHDKTSQVRRRGEHGHSDRHRYKPPGASRSNLMLTDSRERKHRDHK